MAIAEMFFWWYSSGWLTFLKKVHGFILSITDFFSMNSLIRTLFKPFRQISAETTSAEASLDLKFHMFLDRLISRIIGFFSRLILLITGIVIIITGCLFSLVFVILWPIIPLTPILGIILTVLGVAV